MPYFHDLGLPLPLFQAPLHTSGAFLGWGVCAVTGRASPNCFDVSSVLAQCPRCGVSTQAVRVSEVPCWRCGAAVPPAKRAGERLDGAEHVADFENRTGLLSDLRREPRELVVSWEALRSRHAAFHHETEHGPISLNTCLSGSSLSGVPTNAIWELLGTPGYVTWQGYVWLFHCDQPMIFLGESSSTELKSLSLTDVDREELSGLVSDARAEIDEGFMLYRCQTCRSHRFRFDID